MKRAETTGSGRAATIKRRVRTIPTMVGGGSLALVAAPLLLPAVTCADLLRRRRRLPTARLVLFLYWYFFYELGGIAASVWLWFATGFGLRTHTRRSQAQLHRLQMWWAAGIYRGAASILGIRFDLSEVRDDLADGPYIYIGRHAGYFDAGLPMLAAGIQARHQVRYVLMQELLQIPALDIVGHRLRNHFVDRDPASGDAELEAISRLADGINEDVLVLFPEGRFYTPEVSTRIQQRIRERDPELAERAATFRNVLPPRAGGFLAMLAAAPEADVVMVGHDGLTGMAQVKGIIAHSPLDEPINVRSWRFDRSELPDSPEEQLDWLFAQWRVLDDWLEDCTATPPASHRSTRDNMRRQG